MKLILSHGYPFPYPDGFAVGGGHHVAEADALAQAASGHRFTLDGVTTVQFMHTVTVEFKDKSACQKAQKATGWAEWSPLVLEAWFVGGAVAPSPGGYGSGVELIVPALAYDGIVQAPSTSFCDVMMFED